MKIRNKVSRFLALAGTALAVNMAVVTSAQAVCYIDASTPKAVIKPQIKASEQAIVRALDAMDKTVSTAMEFQTAALLASVNTLSSQKALAAKQVGKSVLNNTQLQTTAVQQVNAAHKAKQAVIDYGPRSTGHQVCQVLAQRTEIKSSEKASERAVGVMVNSEVTARPGRYSSRGSALATRLALHDKLYCTASQAASGLCAGEAPRAGKSLQAATMYIPSDYDSPDYRDKSAFINNMVGLPDEPLSQLTAATVQGQTYADLKRRKDAIKSTAIVSLKSLQAAWSNTSENEHSDGLDANVSANVANSEAAQLEQAGNMPSAKAMTPEEKEKLLKKDPLAVQIKNDINRYLGSGDEYQAWSKTLVATPERGVLQEVLRVKAARLYLKSQHYKQLSRMEAMLAANVAAETYRTGMESNIERQRQIAVRKNVSATLSN